MNRSVRTRVLVVCLLLSIAGCRHPREESAIARHVDHTCAAWTRDLDGAAAAYEQYASSHDTLETAAALPYGSTWQERGLVMPRLTDRWNFCRSAPRDATTAQLDQVFLDEAAGAKDFLLADDPKRVAAGIRKMADAARRLNDWKLRE